MDNVQVGCSLLTYRFNHLITQLVLTHADMKAKTWKISISHVIMVKVFSCTLVFTNITYVKTFFTSGKYYFGQPCIFSQTLFFCLCPFSNRLLSLSTTASWTWCSSLSPSSGNLFQTVLFTICTVFSAQHPAAPHRVLLLSGSVPSSSLSNWAITWTQSYSRWQQPQARYSNCVHLLNCNEQECRKTARCGLGCRVRCTVYEKRNQYLRLACRRAQGKLTQELFLLFGWANPSNWSWIMAESRHLWLFREISCCVYICLPAFLSEADWCLIIMLLYAVSSI